jgi:L-alanine-DL-glutamate epimerase-like enolase superfamily enzyme
MSLYDLVASLPLRIEGYALEGLARSVSSGFERKSTIIVLQGVGEEGRGEDVTYEPEAHDAQQQAGPVLDLAGDFTFDSFSEQLATLDLFPGYAPEQDVYRRYRRWGFESAALDLALRQAGTSLHELLGRTPAPVTFVVSSRMGEPPTIEPVARRLAAYPTLRFKLDATPDWPEQLIVALQETGAAIRTRRTTSRPADTTRSTPSRGCRKARSTSTRRRSGSGAT